MAGMGNGVRSPMSSERGLGYVAYVGQNHTVRSTLVGPDLRKPVQLNEYDQCLRTDEELWHHFIAKGGLARNCCPRGRKPYRERPWVQMPAGGRRFRPISNALVSSLIFDGTDQTILETRVPYGYDGVIMDTVNEITASNATGFDEGSGDITWRLEADDRYLRDYGAVTVSVGSLVMPSPIQRGGLRVYSGNILRFVAAMAPGAENRLNPNARIICSISGWWYPR